MAVGIKIGGKGLGENSLTAFGHWCCMDKCICTLERCLLTDRHMVLTYLTEPVNSKQHGLGLRHQGDSIHKGVLKQKHSVIQLLN